MTDCEEVIKLIKARQQDQVMNRLVETMLAVEDLLGFKPDIDVENRMVVKCGLVFVKNSEGIVYAYIERDEESIRSPAVLLNGPFTSTPEQSFMEAINSKEAYWQMRGKILTEKECYEPPTPKQSWLKRVFGTNNG